MASPIQPESGDPGRAVEDYVKAVFSLGRASGNGQASVGALATRLGVTPGSASAMVKRLAAQGLVVHEPYKGVVLTDEGEALALSVIRRHRLIESFLAEELGMPWDQVHHEAEVIEHVVSDTVVDLIAAKLGNPTHDPHGDPIPARDLTIADHLATTTLWDAHDGATMHLASVSDTDPAMLRHLAECGIRPGTRITVVEHQPFDGPFVIAVGRTRHSIGPSLARAMRLGDAGDSG